MTDVQVFNFKHLPVRAVLIEGDPWWVATDVAKALGYRDAANMVRLMDDDEKGTHVVSTIRGNQKVLIITEPGLYSAIMRSKSKTVKYFQRWVTHEVLPTLRKTGEYSVRDRDRDMSSKVAAYSKSELLDHYESTTKRFAVIIEESNRIFKAKEAELAQLHRVHSGEGSKNMSTVAKELQSAGLFKGGDRTLYQVLEGWGWVMHRRVGGNALKREAMQYAVNQGYLVMEPRTRPDGKPASTCMVTPRGKLAIVNRLRDEPQKLSIQDLGGHK